MKQACVLMNLNALQTATGRSVFEYIATKIETHELFDTTFGPDLHPVRVIGPGSRRNEANSSVIDHKPKRFTRHAQSHFELGTNRHPLDMPTERVGKKCVTLVPSV